jgi:hypothetical protein
MRTHQFRFLSSPILVVKRRVTGRPNQSIALLTEIRIELFEVRQFVTMVLSVEVG